MKSLIFSTVMILTTAFSAHARAEEVGTAFAGFMTTVGGDCQPSRTAEISQGLSPLGRDPFVKGYSLNVIYGRLDMKDDLIMLGSGDRELPFNNWNPNPVREVWQTRVEGFVLTSNVIYQDLRTGSQIRVLYTMIREGNRVHYSRMISPAVNGVSKFTCIFEKRSF